MTTLSKEAQEARRQYQKEWRARNKDKCKQYRQNYWEKVARQTDREEQEG